MVTPEHIVPEWYFLPFYAILRSITDKLQGVIAMLVSIFILILVPLVFNNIKETNFFFKSSSFKLHFSIVLTVFVSTTFFLGCIGGNPAVQPFITFSMIATVVYFLTITVGLYVVSFLERFSLINVNSWFLLSKKKLIPKTGVILVVVHKTKSYKFLLNFISKKFNY